MLDRDEDMKSTGMRHPFLAKYKVAIISRFLNCLVKSFKIETSFHEDTYIQVLANGFKRSHFPKKFMLYDRPLSGRIFL